MPPSQDLRDIRLDLVDPNLFQPRRYFDEKALEELAGSIGERGILQPVLVRPLENGRYGLVAGERRWRAAKIAGLESIPALVSPYDDLAALEIGLIENIAREDLNPVEEARAYATLAREFGLTQQQIGDRVGRSRVAITNHMRILGLSEGILELVERGELSVGHARALLSVKDPLVRSQLANAAIERGWTMRVLEDRARESNMGLPESRQGVGEGEKGREGELDSTHGQARDETAMNVARVWGDALGAEVTVRSLPSRKLRVELLFDSPEGAFALGGRIGEAVARGTKRR
jgi:ParB family transcriptional regulator, chromosome partitioning protein